MKIIRVGVLLFLLGLCIEGLGTVYKIDVITEAEASQRTVQKIGAFDIVTGSDGYQGAGRQVGRFYLYSDND